MDFGNEGSFVVGYAILPQLSKVRHQVLFDLLICYLLGFVAATDLNSSQENSAHA